MIAKLFVLVLVCWGFYEYLQLMKRTFKGIIKDYEKIKAMEKEFLDFYEKENKDV